MTTTRLLIQTIAITAAVVVCITVAVLRPASTASSVLPINSNLQQHQPIMGNNDRRSLRLLDPKSIKQKLMGNLEQDAAVCQPVSEAQRTSLTEEIRAYEKSEKFRTKINEVKRGMHYTRIHKVIAHYLRTKVLRPGWSVLELGCAAGAMLLNVKQGYESAGTAHGPFVGVELVTGWVKFATNHFQGTDVHVYEGDITSFELPEPFVQATFDFVMLNDVAEHIQKDRYGCFFQKLREVTHEGSIVYMHTPNPTTQLMDSDQYYENVLPHHFLIAGMAYAGFELVNFEHDTDIRCENDMESHPKYPTTVDGSKPAMIAGAPCTALGMPKFYHIVFRRVDQQPVFTLN